VSSWTGHNIKEDVLGIGAYQLKLYSGKELVIHNALFALGYGLPLCLWLLYGVGFYFTFHRDSLDIFYNGKLLGHVTLKGDFIVLDLAENYSNTSSTFISYFNSNSKSVTSRACLVYVG